MVEEMYSVIAKVLSGEATAAEQQELQAWLSSDPKHQRLYDDMKLVWDDTDVLLQKPEFDSATAWQKVKARTNITEGGTAGRVIGFPNWQKYMLAAAAVLVIGFLAFWNMQDRETVIVVASSGNSDVVLPDGSHVTVREGSSLEYEKDFNDGRTVALKGEAFFDVQRDEQHPFSINAGNATVRVLGTSFNVSEQGKTVNVTVVTGKVELRSRKGKDLSVILTPGHKGVLTPDAVTREAAPSDNFLYWKTGALEFNNKPLEQVLDEISRSAGVAIQFDPSATEEIKKQDVTISFSKQSPEDMLTELCLITDCRLEKQGDIYLIRAGK
jgi:ferric-dicitrate binding protein FerR (iron transport regulator)